MLIPFFKKLNDSKSVLINILLVFVCGIISTLLALLLALIQGNLIVLSSSLQGSFGAPILGVFICGCLFKFTNEIGAIAATVIGFLAGSWLSIGANIISPDYPKLIQMTDFCNYTDNYTSKEIYELYYKEIMIETNKYNSTIFADGKRATNLNGFSVFYSLSYMYTFFLV